MTILLGALNNKIYKKMLENDKELFHVPTFTEDKVLEYYPKTNLSEDEFFKISNFSKNTYCLDIMKANFNSVDYDLMKRNDFVSLNFIISIQNNFWCFQKINKSNLIRKKMITIGNNYEYREDFEGVPLNYIADAFYSKTEDILYFKKLNRLTSIFEKINTLYKIATNEETEQFFNEAIVKLANKFKIQNISVANRRKIALINEKIKNQDIKKELVEYISNYYPNLKKENGEFLISNNSDLKVLLDGLDEKFYTAPITKEKRLANSIIPLK